MNDLKALDKIMRHLQKAMGYYLVAELDCLFEQEEASLAHALNTASSVVSDAIARAEAQDDLKVGGTD